MQRPLTKLLVEAISIGIITSIIATSLKILLKKDGLIIYFLSGGIIHVFFEYLDLNKMWCNTEFKVT